MASTGTVVEPMHASGSVYGPRLSDRELKESREYDKILRLRDDVFADRHPRLKIPTRGKLTTRSLQSPSTSVSISTPRLEPPKSSAPAPSEIAPYQNGYASSHPPTQSNGVVASNIQRSIPAKPTSSGIDPILLTKSDDLVRAEIQLQRQRIERALKEEFDQKRNEPRVVKTGYDYPAPDFDLSQVLTKAQEIVPPVDESKVMDTQAAATAASDSFDENSFYSSQVDSSSGRGRESTHEPLGEDHQAQAMDVDGFDADVYSIDHAKAVGQAQPNGPTAVDQNLGPAPFVDKPDRQPQEIILEGETRSPTKAGAQNATRQTIDVQDEEEYSPPEPITPDELRELHRDTDIRIEAAGALPAGPRQLTDRPAQAAPRRATQKRPRPASPTSPDVPIIRNHLASPLAPQPSRVSPLAVAKGPPIAQEQVDYQIIRDDQGSRAHEGLRGSPGDANPRPVVSRKRRRRAERAEGRADAEGARKGPGRRLVESPQPYIKEEPLSPPQFANVPEMRQPAVYRRTRERIGMEDASPRELRAEAYYEREYESPLAVRYEIQSPLSPVQISGPSRTGFRRPERDGQDLRRIASLQYARQPASPPPLVQYSPTDIRPVRAASQAFIERPVSVAEQSRYHPETIRPYTTRYVRADRSRSPPPLRERFSPIEQPHLVMAPPPRRIVVDQYGNKYYADVRRSVAPTSRMSEARPYYEQEPVRERVMRAPITEADLYDESSYAQRMAPPSPAPRRVIEQPEYEPLDDRTYRERDYAPRDPNLVAVREYAERRQPSHLEGAPAAGLGDGRLRLQSVRPTSHRYEAMREYIPRIQSARPDHQEYAAGMQSQRDSSQMVAPRIIREPSVRVDDGRRLAEYLPPDGSERISYVPQVPQGGRRFITEESADVMEYAPPTGRMIRDVAGGTNGGDASRRASYRY
ncbi:MAG: hypothetical protein M1819_006396 [Sarea resinae]|nr:MAG: hypothetical protein M1819_006396 [Sarea resinae]